MLLLHILLFVVALAVTGGCVSTAVAFTFSTSIVQSPPRASTWTQLRAVVNEEEDDETETGIPQVLRILQTERPYLNETTLEHMCQQYPLLRKGKVWRVVTSRNSTRVLPGIGKEENDELYHSLLPDSTSSTISSTLKKKNMRSIPLPLLPEHVHTVVSDLYDVCGYTDEDLVHMLTIHPLLIGSNTKVKQNFDYLVEEVGMTPEWVRQTARRWPGLYHRGLEGKVQQYHRMGFDDAGILHLIQASHGRIFSYDIERKLDEFRALGFDEDDIFKLCQRGGNVFGMDLRRRFQRLEEVGFQDVITLVKRYPQLLSLRTKTIEQLVEADLGLSFQDVVRMAEKCPSILGLNATRAVERLEVLVPPTTTPKKGGRSRRRAIVGKLVRSFPQALTYDIDQRVDRLATLLMDADNNEQHKEQPSSSPQQQQQQSPSSRQVKDARSLLGQMFLLYPPILGYNLAARVALLEEAGIPPGQALRALPKFPQLVSYDASSRMQKLKDAGFRPPFCTVQQLGKLIGSFPPLIGYDIETKLKGLQHYIGVNQTQALQMVISYPRIVGVSAERTVGPAAQFLLSHNANVTVDYLAQHPRILTRSVEGCLAPRAARLLEIGVDQLAPMTLVSFSNKQFQQKYGNLGDPVPIIPDAAAVASKNKNPKRSKRKTGKAIQAG